MGRRHMPTENSPERSSRMASGKRASMREGPLAALFRKTEEEGVEGRQEPPAPKSDTPAEAPAPARVEHARPAQERLRDVFSSEIPHNIMDREPVRASDDRPRYGREAPVAPS